MTEHLSRRGFLGALAAPAILSGASRPPNIVIALCDDLGYGDLGCFGSQSIQTPNLDRMAAQGVRLTDCYAAAPVCSPSRAGMLTGRTPDRCGVYDWIPAGSPMHLGRDEVTFAKILKDAGYATCHSGKWHCNGKFNSPEQPQPGDHGFDHWFSTQNNAAPNHANPTNFVRNGQKVGKLAGYSSTVIVDEALAWLRRLDGKQPFCLFACFHSPHEDVATAPNFVGQYPNAAKRGEALYYGNVTQLDYEFGRLLRNLDENTFVLFTSDNGPETLNRYPNAWRSHGSAAPLRGMKLEMYEGGYRVPGIVRWPGRAPAGRVSREAICGVDLLPTLCALAGARVPTDRPMDGADFLPALSGKPVRRSVPLHWHYFNAMSAPKASLRDGDWKVVGIPAKPTGLGPGAGFQPSSMAIIKNQPLESFELYNLRADIGETRDLSKQEPRRLKQLAGALTKLHEQVRAGCPVWT